MSKEGYHSCLALCWLPGGPRRHVSRWQGYLPPPSTTMKASSRHWAFFIHPEFDWQDLTKTRDAVDLVQGGGCGSSPILPLSLPPPLPVAWLNNISSTAIIVSRLQPCAFHITSPPGYLPSQKLLLRFVLLHSFAASMFLSSPFAASNGHCLTYPPLRSRSVDYIVSLPSLPMTPF